MTEQLKNLEHFLPRDYLIRARDFYLACRELPDFDRAYMPLWPQLALFGLAIELVLKAFLLSKGVTAKELKDKYGHKLELLYQRSVELGLPTAAKVTEMISFINQPYSKHRPRYPDYSTQGEPVATVPQFYETYEMLVGTVEDEINAVSQPRT